MAYETVQHAGRVFVVAGNFTLIVDAFGSCTLSGGFASAGSVKCNYGICILRIAGRLAQQEGAEGELDSHAQYRAAELHCCDPDSCRIESRAFMNSKARDDFFFDLQQANLRSLL